MVPRHRGGGEELGSDRLRTEQLFRALAAGPAGKTRLAGHHQQQEQPAIRACRTGPAAAVKSP